MQLPLLMQRVHFKSHLPLLKRHVAHNYRKQVYNELKGSDILPSLLVVDASAFYQITTYNKIVLSSYLNLDRTIIRWSILPQPLLEILSWITYKYIGM